MRRWWIAAVLVVAVLGGVAVWASRSHPAGRLDVLAEGAWRARNEYLVYGATTTEPEWAAWLASQRSSLDARRAGLGDVRYVGQETRLVEVEETFARRDRARVTVRIESRLDMRGPAGTPPSTWAGEELEFHFRWSGGRWVLDHVVPLGKA
jgi:hypothetical protein